MRGEFWHPQELVAVPLAPFLCAPTVFYVMDQIGQGTFTNTASLHLDAAAFVCAGTTTSMGGPARTHYRMCHSELSTVL